MIAGQVMGLLFFRVHGGKQRELLTLCCALCVQLHWLDWWFFVDDVTRYETQVPYVFVDPSLRREHDALTQFSLLGFLPLIERLGAEGAGKHPQDRESPPRQPYDQGGAVSIFWCGWRR